MVWSSSDSLFSLTFKDFVGQIKKRQLEDPKKFLHGFFGLLSSNSRFAVASITSDSGSSELRKSLIAHLSNHSDGLTAIICFSTRQFYPRRLSNCSSGCLGCSLVSSWIVFLRPKLCISWICICVFHSFICHCSTIITVSVCTSPFFWLSKAYRFLVCQHSSPLSYSNSLWPYYKRIPLLSIHLNRQLWHACHRR